MHNVLYTIAYILNKGLIKDWDVLTSKLQIPYEAKS
jgi:hypothetical protein